MKLSRSLRTVAGITFGWLRAEFGWMVLLGGAIALMGVYILYKRLEADREALLAFARVTCASSGQAFDASVDQARDAKGKPMLVKHARGKLCASRIAALADFERDTAIASATLLAEAQADRGARHDQDRDAAMLSGKRAAAATAAMEKKNASVQADDRVDGEWFARLNDLAGMHPDR